jgi:glutaredoxin/glutathione-dependent peroxiredoxin
MALRVGERLPEAVLLEFTGGEPTEVPSEAAFAGRVAVFAMPGAFSRTCGSLHMPSVIRTADALRAEGVDQIVILSVNDPFVMAAWGQNSGATDAGIRMLADADGAFTRAVEMAFDAPPIGFYGRSRRYGMIVEDGVVVALGVEEGRGVCAMSGGEALLDALRQRRAEVG